MGHNQQQPPGGPGDYQRYMAGQPGLPPPQQQQQQMAQMMQANMMQANMYSQQQQQQQQMLAAQAAQAAAKRKADTPDGPYDPKRQQLPLQQQQQRPSPGPPGPPIPQQPRQMPLGGLQQQQPQQLQQLLPQAAGGMRLVQPGVGGPQQLPRPGVQAGAQVMGLVGAAQGTLLTMRPAQLVTGGGAPGPPAAVSSPGTVAAAGALGGDVFSAPIVNAEAVVNARLPVARRLVPDGRGGTTASVAQDEQGKILPRSQLDRLMKMQGLDTTFRLAPEVQGELSRLAEEFVSDLVERGCQLAAIRKANTLRALDLAPYLERAHHIRIPGFGNELRPYRRPNASELHRERAAAVRQSAAAGGGGAGGGGAGGAGGAGAGGGKGRGGAAARGGD